MAVKLFHVKIQEAMVFVIYEFYVIIFITAADIAGDTRGWQTAFSHGEGGHRTGSLFPRDTKIYEGDAVKAHIRIISYSQRYSEVITGD